MLFRIYLLIIINRMGTNIKRQKMINLLDVVDIVKCEFFEAAIPLSWTEMFRIGISIIIFAYYIKKTCIPTNGIMYDIACNL